MANCGWSEGSNGREIELVYRSTGEAILLPLEKVLEKLSNAHKNLVEF